MSKDGLVAIGELARHTGVATSTLRYYERLGLLSPTERAGQQRRYTASSAQRVALVRLYQDAGFTLAEIATLLAAHTQGREGWDDLARRKITELDIRITDAQRAKELIQHALKCPHRELVTCPNFHSALQDHLAAAGRLGAGAKQGTEPSG